MSKLQCVRISESLSRGLVLSGGLSSCVVALDGLEKGGMAASCVVALQGMTAEHKDYLLGSLAMDVRFIEPCAMETSYSTLEMR